MGQRIAARFAVLFEQNQDLASQPAKMATSQPTRAYDSLYDKNYTVSGSRDYYRDQARAGGFTLERVPQYGNFFSEIPTYPSQTVRFRNVDKVPPSVNREFKGNAAATNAEIAYKSTADRVSGNNRYMFFRRPLYAPSNQMLDQPPPNVVLEPHDPIPDGEVENLNLPKLARTFGTQSDYREMETQTQPYEPDYVLPKEMSVKQQKLDDKFHLNGMPEVLTLKDFKVGEGEKLQLPVGLYEVQKIEKMREKRAFEASLPPLSDQSKIHVRKRMLDEWESKEWAYRENEIKIVQDERLEKMEQALLRRERKLEAETKKRLEKLERQKVSDNQALLADIQKRRIKTMRKLEKRRQLSAFKPEKPTRAEDYANYGSKVYAPLTRDGKAADSAMADGNAIDPVPYQPREITNFVSMQDTLHMDALAPEDYKKLPKDLDKEQVGPRDKDLGQKEAKMVTKQLEHVMDLLEASKTENGRRGIGSCWPEPLAQNQQKQPSAMEQAKKKKKVQMVEEVAVVEIPDPKAIAAENAIVLLQRLLRGRATQNEMYSGKEKRLDLIEELQTTKEQELPAAASTPEEAALDAALGVHFAELLDILAINDAKQQTVLLYEGQDKWADVDRQAGMEFDTPPSTSGSSRVMTAGSRGLSSRATSRGTVGMMSRGSAGFGPLNPDLQEEPSTEQGLQEMVQGESSESSQYIDDMVDNLVVELSAELSAVSVQEPETETHKEEEEEEEPKIGLSIEFPEGEDEEGISLSISLSGETEPSMPIWLKLWLSYDSVVRG